MPKGRQKVAPGPGSSQLRIIGGSWRGRRLPVLCEPGLRPTPGRVRETLFNWLRNHVGGSRCLDLFAGSGALGLEALSRGAAHATLIDSNHRVCEQILLNLKRLDTLNAEVHRIDSMSWLRSFDGVAFDIVFIDPPFDSELSNAVLQQLHDSAAIASGTHIYVEQSVSEPALRLPGNWQTLRAASAGQVHYQLIVAQSV